MLRGEDYKRVQNSRELNYLFGNPFVAFLGVILINAIRGISVARYHVKLVLTFPLIFYSTGGNLKHIMNQNYSDKKPVLIVEDIATNRELFTLQLRQFGLATQYAINGKEALELVQAHPDAFSMILMDLQMPVMDGITATRLIRQHENLTNGHITIVALTANEAEGIDEECFNAGMDDFIRKPMTLAKLEHLLAKWFKDS